MSAKIKAIVSARGQLTLPSEVRKKLGIEEGSIVILEERDGEVILKPATVLEVDFYSDKDIQSWVKDDQLSPKDRAKIEKRLSNQTKK